MNHLSASRTSRSSTGQGPGPLHGAVIHVQAARIVYAGPAGITTPAIWAGFHRGSGSPGRRVADGRAGRTSPARTSATPSNGGQDRAGTDAAVAPHGRNLRELEHLVNLGMSPAGAIVAGTGTAAEPLGLADELGTIQAGKIADLIVGAGGPLADITLLGEPENVVAVSKPASSAGTPCGGADPAKLEQGSAGHGCAGEPAQVGGAQHVGAVPEGRVNGVELAARAAGRAPRSAGCRSPGLGWLPGWRRWPGGSGSPFHCRSVTAGLMSARQSDQRSRGPRSPAGRPAAPPATGPAYGPPRAASRARPNAWGCSTTCSGQP